MLLKRYPVILVFVVSFLFLLILENHARPSTDDGIHFQNTSSSRMMQALNIQELRSHPIQSLWYLHMQPPMLDTIRAVLSQRHNPRDPAELERSLDKDMYMVWLSAYALINALIFLWLSKLFGRILATVFTMVWALNPSAMYYATYLEGTQLSSLGVLWLFYEIWLISSNKGSTIRLILASLVLFFLRTTFQWPFFVLMIFVLYLSKAPPKRIIIYTIITFAVIFAFLAKQQLLFGTTSTTTFGGYHLLGVIKHKPTPKETDRARSMITFDYPTEAGRYTGDLYNSHRVYEDNLIYSNIFRERLFNKPIVSIRALTESFLQSLSKFLKPSHRISPKLKNSLTENLFYSPMYDWIFSGWRLMLLYISAAACWIRRTQTRHIALALPLIYIFLLINCANIHGWVESDRLKFMIEPVLYIFVITAWVPTLKHWLRARNQR